MGVAPTIAAIKSAVSDALSSHPSTQDCPLRMATFTAAWVGIAGYDRPSIQPQVDKALSALLRLPIGEGLLVSTDIDLLPAAITPTSEIDSAIVLVAGTGSIAMRYQKHASGFVRTGRAGGWGHLLGDDGSGYSLGREGARIALQASDVHRSTNLKSRDLSCFSPLGAAVLKHVRKLDPSCQPDDILSGILSLGGGPEDTTGPVPSPAKAVAQLAEVVLSLSQSDEEANRIVNDGAASLFRLVTLLAQSDKLDLSRTALVFGGGLMQDQLYRSKVLEHLRQQLGDFAHVEFVAHPVQSGAQHLLSRCTKSLEQLQQ